jgi:hypothetical protein
MPTLSTPEAEGVRPKVQNNVPGIVWKNDRKDHLSAWAVKKSFHPLFASRLTPALPPAQARGVGLVFLVSEANWKNLPYANEVS